MGDALRSPESALFGGRDHSLAVYYPGPEQLCERRERRNPKGKHLEMEGQDIHTGATALDSIRPLSSSHLSTDRKRANDPVIKQAGERDEGGNGLVVAVDAYNVQRTTYNV